MFFNSVFSGIKILTYWEVYVACLEFLGISMVPLVVSGIFMSKFKSTEGKIGCLSFLILPFTLSGAVVVMMLSLSPIIFGFGEEAFWRFPLIIISMFPWSFFKLLFFIIISCLVFALIPIIGKMPSMHIILIGCISLAYSLETILRFHSLGTILNSMPNTVQEHIIYFPGFLFSIFLLIIGGIFSLLGMMVSNITVTWIEDRWNTGGVAEFVMSPVVAIFGFIPVFIYGAWLGAQVTGKF